MRIEQTLHGYYKGHGMLASSNPLLDLEDSTLLFKLSDWSGYHVQNNEEEDCYFTLYPLPSKKYYAIAKSWYAYEMERSGCVWTHTLLIPCSDISEDFDFRYVYKYFKRPEDEDYSSYQIPIEIKEENPNNLNIEPVFKDFNFISILFLYAFLVSKNKGACLKIERKQSELQLLALTFLQYLPTGYLEHISISTGSETPRKIGNDLFSIQFISDEHAISIDKDMPWNEKVTVEDFNQGLQYIISESLKPEDETPYLIRLFDKDIGDDDKKFIAVANLLRLLDDVMLYKPKQDSNKYKDVLDYILPLFPRPQEGLTVKRNFFSERITRLFCSDKDFLYTVATYGNIDEGNYDLMDFDDRMVSLRNDNYIDFVNLIKSLASQTEYNAATLHILIYSLKELEEVDINPIIETNWTMMFRLIINNKDFILKGYWLDFSTEHFCDYFNSLDTNYGNESISWNRLLDKVFSAKCLVEDKWIEHLLKHPDNAIEKILDKANQNEISTNLIRACNIDINQCIVWISNQTSFSNNIIRFIINEINPSSYEVKRTDSSIWLPLLVYDDKELDYSYYSFIFILSFNWHDENTLKFLSHSLDCIYLALSNDALPNRCWKEIEPFTEDFGIIFEWDKCKRLCAGVISYLKKHNFKSEVVEKISTRNKIRKRLYKMW